MALFGRRSSQITRRLRGPARARFEPLEIRQMFAAGGIDSTFGSTGIQQTIIYGSGAYGTDVGLQSDQKVIALNVVLPQQPDASNPPYITLTRYTPDGKLDYTFGSGGEADALSQNHLSWATRLLVQSDNEILVTGQLTNAGVSTGFIVRFTANGALDTTFGTGGFVQTAAGAGVTALALQSDGKILAASPSASAGGTTMFLTRYSSSGAVDTTFGAQGTVQTAGSGAVPSGLLQQTGGNIVMAGVSGSKLSFFQFSASGTPIKSFQTLVGGQDRPGGLIEQPDGKLVAAGTATDASTKANSVFLVRLNADLTLDTSFGTAGVSQSDPNSAITAQFGYPDSLVVQTNGKLVVGTSVKSGSSTQFSLARYNANGTLDSAFGTGGISSLPLGNNPAGVALQQDGNILFTGANSSGGLYSATGILARFLGDPVAVNQAPSFKKGLDQSVGQSSSAQSVANWATSLSPGSAQETSQTLNFIVHAANTALFATQPAISPQGTLSYAAAAGKVGATTITVQLHDNGGTANGGQDTSAAQTFLINIGSNTPFTNPLIAPDVNSDGSVTPIDALLVINDLNANGVHGVGVLPNPPNGPWAYLDPNGSGSVTPLDALLVINYLNAHPLSVVADSTAVTQALAAPGATIQPNGNIQSGSGDQPQLDPTLSGPTASAGSSAQFAAATTSNPAPRRPARLGTISPSLADAALADDSQA